MYNFFIVRINEKTMKKLPFKPESVTKRLLKNLSDRSRQILERRYGIGAVSKRETLESIGKDHRITRERVRQIENHSIHKLKSFLNEEDIQTVFAYLKDTMAEYGHVMKETEFLDTVSEKPNQKNHLYFIMMLSADFLHSKENDFYYNRWTINRNIQEQVEEALMKLTRKMDEQPLSEGELIARFQECLKDTSPYLADTDRNILHSWIGLSKHISKNPFHEWGVADSPYIRPRGIRDLAYLYMRRQGSPMHFREVANGIETTLQKNAHPQTVHNELIKDNRFVLVGRGLYALTEWGYQPGIVRDVIISVLKKNPALLREELIKKVLKERHVKENTILINLQNKKFFKKSSDGKYMLA